MLTGKQLGELIDAGASPEVLKIVGRIIDEFWVQKVTNVTERNSNVTSRALYMRNYRVTQKNKEKQQSQVTEKVTRNIESENAIESDLTSLLPLEPIEKKKDKITTRGTRLDVTELPLDWHEFCKRERKDLDPLKTFEAFSDWWLAAPGAKGIKLDWAATWRTWVRNQKVARPAGNGFTRNEGPVESAEETYNRMKAKGMFV